MSKKISVFLFAFFIVLFPVLSLLSPYRSHSDVEKRDLAKFPALTLSSYADRGFANGFNLFISDHFAGRDAWMVAHTALTLLTGSRESGTSVDTTGDQKNAQTTAESDQGGQAFLGKGCLIGDLPQPDSAASPDYRQENGKFIYQNNAAAIDAFAKTHALPVYLMLVPTAEEVESDKLPAFAPAWSQKAMLRQVYGSFQSAKPLDVLGALTAHKNEYIYYRTDHHWTSLGAYYAYQASGKALGFTPLPLSAFRVETVSTNFNGTLYNESGYRMIKPDQIDLYHNKAGDNIQSLLIENGGAKKTYPGIYFPAALKTADQYNVFFNSNNTLETVKTGNGNKKLLLVKDSFALSLAPFLCNQYGEITMIDMRGNTDTLDQMVNVKDYDAVLFCINVEEFESDSDIQNINP